MIDPAGLLGEFIGMLEDEAGILLHAEFGAGRFPYAVLGRGLGRGRWGDAARRWGGRHGWRWVSSPKSVGEILFFVEVAP